MNNEIIFTTSTIEALSHDFRAVAHNLANINTIGYKRLQTSFFNALQEAMDSSGELTGEVEAAMSIDFTQGSMIHTGRPLDLALQGNGFFVIETPEGPLYTRKGTFYVNQNSQLVDTEGRTVAGEAGPVVIPSTHSPLKVQVDREGSVSAGGQTIGTLRLVEFENLSDLESVGGSCFRLTTAVTPKEALQTTVHQGYQETSNVPPTKELVRLITLTRLYQANIKSVQTLDDQMKYLLQVALGS
jgi:flagellar basal-body rod protein FlgF